MTDLEVLAELIKLEREGYELDLVSLQVGHPYGYSAGYIEGLNRAAEIAQEFIDEK